MSTLTGDLALLSLDIIDPVPDSKMPRGKVESVSILSFKKKTKQIKTEATIASLIA